MKFDVLESGDVITDVVAVLDELLDDNDIFTSEQQFEFNNEMHVEGITILLPCCVMKVLISGCVEWRTKSILPKGFTTG